MTTKKRTDAQRKAWVQVNRERAEKRKRDIDQLRFSAPQHGPLPSNLDSILDQRAPSREEWAERLASILGSVPMAYPGLGDDLDTIEHSLAWWAKHYGADMELSDLRPSKEVASFNELCGRVPAFVWAIHREIRVGLLFGNFDKENVERLVHLAIVMSGFFTAMKIGLVTGREVASSARRREALERINNSVIQVRASVLRDGRLREGYEKRPVTDKERAEVLRLNKALANEFTVDAHRYREIAERTDSRERRVRNIVEKAKRTKTR